MQGAQVPSLIRELRFHTLQNNQACTAQHWAQNPQLESAGRNNSSYVKQHKSCVRQLRPRAVK